jgi:hypothetical protein
MKIASLTATLLLAFTGTAFAADHMLGIAAEPNPAKVGQAVKITVTGDTDPSVYCGMKINFGDGKDERKVVGEKEPFPRSVTYTYANPGTYTIRADGTKVDGRFGCTGKVMAQLVVEAPPKPAAAPAAKAAAGPACPEGYKLKGKAGKAGDFTCAAGKGAKKPEKVMECGDKLEFFQTKTTLGCRKAKK